MCTAENRPRCSFCRGRGWETCYVCKGHGHIDCFHCRGSGGLRCFIKMHVVYTTHVDDFVDQSRNVRLPSDLVRTAGGALLFQAEGVRVCPLFNFPELLVNQESQRLLDEHERQISATERLLLQRHRIRSVPISQCSYSYKGKTGVFYVYGSENHVHAPDYPQKCCCTCSVL